MKLSQIRACDSCAGVLAPGGTFYVLRTSLALVIPQAHRQVLGLMTMFNGALSLAEALAPDSEVVKVAGDENAVLMSEFLVCPKCYMGGHIDLARMAEARVNKER